MKLSVPCSFNIPMPVTPPIGLKRPHSPKFNKDQVQTFKCRSDPTYKDSSAYNIAVPYFNDGSPEELIYFQRFLKRATDGQGDTTGPSQFAKVRMLLQGEALSAFEAQVTVTNSHTETLTTVQEALDAVTASIFPDRAAQIQKKIAQVSLKTN